MRDGRGRIGTTHHGGQDRHIQEIVAEEIKQREGTEPGQTWIKKSRITPLIIYNQKPRHRNGIMNMETEQVQGYPEQPSTAERRHNPPSTPCLKLYNGVQALIEECRPAIVVINETKELTTRVL